MSDVKPKKSVLALVRSVNLPTRITMCRILLIPVFVLVVMRVGDDPRWRYGALALMVVMGLSDIADGVLARRMNLKTKLGAFLDPLADKLLMTTAYVLFASHAYTWGGRQFPAWLTVLVVSRDVLICVGFVVIHFIKGAFRFEPNWAGKTATVLMVSTLVVHLATPPLPARLFWLLAWLTAGIVLLSGALYAGRGLAQLAETEETG